LIEFSGHVKVVNSGLATINSIKDDERVNFKVGEVKVDVNGVEADEEVDEGILLLGRDMSEEGSGDIITGGEWLVDRDIKDESFGIDVTDVNTTLVSEENAVALALRINADVVFSVRGMREEGFNNEVVKGASHSLNLVSCASAKSI
jgi:hypothetical protein